MKKLTKRQQTMMNILQVKRKNHGGRYYAAEYIGATTKTLNSLVRLGLLETKRQRTFSAPAFKTGYRAKEIKDG